MGREAKARRAAKLESLRQRAAAGGSFKLHITGKEAYAFVVHLTQSGHFDGTGQFKSIAALEKLDCMDLFELMLTKAGATSSITDFNEEVYADVELDGDMLDSVIELCTPSEKKPMGGIIGIVLARLVRRLRDAKNGTYVPPAAEPAGDVESPAEA